MALPSSASTARLLNVPALLLLLSSVALLVFLLLLPSPSSSAAHLCACSSPTTTHTTTTTTVTTTTASPAPVTTSPADVAWLKAQLASNSFLLAFHDAWHRLRKGINPRTREQQLFDINRHHEISHYPDEKAANHIALPCPGKSTTVTTASHRLLAVMFLSSSLLPPPSRPEARFLKLDVGRFVLVCISFGFSRLGGSIACSVMSCRYYSSNAS